MMGLEDVSHLPYNLFVWDGKQPITWASAGQEKEKMQEKQEVTVICKTWWSRQR